MDKVVKIDDILELKGHSDSMGASRLSAGKPEFRGNLRSVGYGGLAMRLVECVGSLHNGWTDHFMGEDP
ncbi:hypothetical protein V6N13_026062 [Hibiscus sabdariffa]